MLHLILTHGADGRSIHRLLQVIVQPSAPFSPGGWLGLLRHSGDLYPRSKEQGLQMEHGMDVSSVGKGNHVHRDRKNKHHPFHDSDIPLSTLASPGSARSSAAEIGRGELIMPPDEPALAAGPSVVVAGEKRALRAAAFWEAAGSVDRSARVVSHLALWGPPVGDDDAASLALAVATHRPQWDEGPASPTRTEPEASVLLRRASASAPTSTAVH